MTTVRLLLAAVLGALSLVLTATPSFACSCAVAGTAEYVDGAATVFTGTVIDKEPPPQRPVMSSDDPVTYTFAVERWFKGEQGDPVRVMSSMSGASCGLEGVRAGQRYVVFATESGGGELWASLCGGTAPWSADLEADVVATTGPGAGAPPSAAPAGTGGTSQDQVHEAGPSPTGAGPEGGFLAVPVALASGLGLVLLAVLLWVRLLLRR